MNLVDGGILLMLAAGFVHGAMKGAIQEVSGVVAIVVGVFVAGKVAAGSESVWSQLPHPTAGKIFAFVIAFILVVLAIVILGRTISNAVKRTAVSVIDRFIGGLFGVCVVGLVLGILFRLLMLGGLELEAVRSSVLGPKLIGLVSYLTRFLPGAPGEVVASLTLVLIPAGP